MIQVGEDDFSRSRGTRGRYGTDLRFTECGSKANGFRAAHDESCAKPAMLPPGNLLPFFLVTALFLPLGDSEQHERLLIPQFMKSFELSRFQAVLVQSAFYSMGYFLLAMPAAIMMK